MLHGHVAVDVAHQAHWGVWRWGIGGPDDALAFDADFGDLADVAIALSITVGLAHDVDVASGVEADAVVAGDEAAGLRRGSQCQ